MGEKVWSYLLGAVLGFGLGLSTATLVFVILLGTIK